MKKIVRAATVPSSLEVFYKDVLRELTKEYEVIGLSSPGEDLEVIADREGIRTIAVPMERRISPLKDLVSLWRLVRVFRKEKPDMVHSITPKAGLLCMMAAWLTRVPVRVHMFTGLVWPTSTGMKRRILMLTDWLTCACATHVIPEGYGVMNDLQAHITKKPMRVLGYGNIKGIDLNYWRCEGNKDKGAGKNLLEDAEGATFTFLCVGRIVGDKGINELVEAFNMLIERKKEKGEGKKCRLVLVGRAEEELDPIAPETQRMIETMPEIEAVGAKYGEELLRCYEEADCFVFPSYREGFPNTVLEAGAMELPSIVTDINGCSEIVIERGAKWNGGVQHLMPGERMSVRENGVMIPSKDVEALYEAMQWMMEHAEERRLMGQRAREIVTERWEQGFVRAKLYEFYREVMR